MRQYQANAKVGDRALIFYGRTDDGQLNGVTFAAIWDGDMRFLGISECSKKDQVNKKRGRLIALGRAKHVMEAFHNPKIKRQSGDYEEFYVKVSDLKVEENHIVVVNRPKNAAHAAEMFPPFLLVEMKDKKDGSQEVQ